MSAALDIASWALIVAGGAFCVIGAVGILRMPDFYTRVHAASVADVVGSFAILLGLALQAGPSLVSVKLVFIAALIFFTSPAATHALVKAAFERGVEPQAAEAPSKH
ncbi:MAG TPA: monovalent cation/H(+) antiporter subunit G [Burkholderiales bacterium]|jgi:multicomponent Na+:H+ antiporter subunit G|nr:monovalent cation/H(+) antiporter subunit G [Burkholderiales bacterium]